MKTFWTVLISVVATVVLVGGGIYYWQSTKAKNDKNNLNTQIASLQSQVKDLQTKAATSTTTTSTTTTTNGATQTLNIQDTNLGDLIVKLGYTVAMGQILDQKQYIDLTADGNNDVVFSVSSGGTAGDSAVYVYGYQGNTLTKLLEEKGYTHYKFSVSNSILTIQAINPNSAANSGKDNASMTYDISQQFKWDGSKLSQI